MYHFKGALKVGEVYHFEIQVERDILLRSIDHISSHGEDAKDTRELKLRVKNTTNALMRPAYLAGPYVLYTAVYESSYRHDTPVAEADYRPHFDANVKASSSRWQHLPLEPHKTSNSDTRVFHLEIASQSIFSPSATTYFEVTLGWTEADVRRLARTGTATESTTPGLEVRRQDTWALWQMRQPERDYAGHHISRARVVRPPPLLSRDKQGVLCDHLVVLTHGIHSNLTADMLYLKQMIERTAQAQGGRVVCKGFTANVCNTERGVRWLGQRVAEWVLNETGWVFEADGQIYRMPNQYKRISFIAHSLGGLVQTYALGWLHDRTYGGFLDPTDLGLLPESFITLATPWLGISAENPAYVKLALDFGIVGKTGQDLGLTVKPLGSYETYSAPQAGSKPPEKPAKVRATRPLLRLLSEDQSPCRRAIALFKRRTVYANIENDGIVPLRTSSLFFLDWEGIEASNAQAEASVVVTPAKSTAHSDIGTVSNSDFSDRETPPTSGVPPATLSASSTEKPDALQVKDPSKRSLTGAVRGVGSLIRRVSMGSTKAEEEQSSPSAPASPLPGADTIDKNQAAEAVEQQSHGTVLEAISNYLRPHSGATTHQSLPTAPAKKKKKASKAFKRSQTIGVHDDEAGDADKSREALVEPKHTSFLRSLEAIVNPPGPDFAFIYDPAKRPKQTIVHDRLYKPSDIPPLKPVGSSKVASTASSDQSVTPVDVEAVLEEKEQASHKHTGHRAREAALTSTSTTKQAAVRLEKVRLEERIARNWHRDVAWRKVLVRLRPDAHNNIIVRRRFANSYGWPVVDHLCLHHFGAEAGERDQKDVKEATDEAEMERVLSGEPASLRPSVRRQKSWDGATLHAQSMSDADRMVVSEDDLSSDGTWASAEEGEAWEDEVIRVSNMTAGL